MELKTAFVNHKLAGLKRSKFRSKFRLAPQYLEYIGAKGLETIRKHAYQIVSTRIAPAFPKNDGKQTPMKGHPVFIAQHATATCCRKCLEKWHGIGTGRALDEKEIDYIVALIMEWVRLQIKR